MSHYKLREGDSIRKPVVKRDRLEIHVPVLLLCLLLAFLIWLYVVSISKIREDLPLPSDTETVTDTDESSGEPDGATGAAGTLPLSLGYAEL